MDWSRTGETINFIFFEMFFLKSFLHSFSYNEYNECDEYSQLISQSLDELMRIDRQISLKVGEIRWFQCWSQSLLENSCWRTPSRVDGRMSYCFSHFRPCLNSDAANSHHISRFWKTRPHVNRCSLHMNIHFIHLTFDCRI
jgi:hypothetical protein